MTRTSSPSTTTPTAANSRQPAPSTSTRAAATLHDHPCHLHRPGHHADDCLAGRCGFCGTSLQSIASGECRSCLRIVCEECDGGYQPDLGSICRPCTPPGNNPNRADSAATDDPEQHRLCVFEFALSCGHLVTAVLTGWYPVVASCCDRLGGTVLRGLYVPYASEIDYVNVLSERYESRPRGTRRPPIQIIGRRPRTDKPHQSPLPRDYTSAGRYPARVGATWSIDGSIPTPETS